METDLKLLQSFCTNTGLIINTSKTKGFHFASKSKTFIYNHDKNWKLGKDTIAYIPPGVTEKYLGARIDPWAGVTKGEWPEKIKAWIKSLQAADLRPAQKIEVLRMHIIPRTYFHLILTEVSQNTLRNLYQIIRNSMKEIVHLPPHVTSGLLYSNNRSGGLGMLKLEVRIPSAIIRKRMALEMSTDKRYRGILPVSGRKQRQNH
ncbi:hypothetical protein scyTo_0019347 [Scyliorhinus torazame]|uniref:Reverse transcriptase domain-containing protein n=1 Tax=Scyliorhinus torazame TaxID=75743 RepID=A0A401PXX9_SCYTO|nr:hypothetical protein [Scyliorhinus torazame]